MLRVPPVSGPDSAAPRVAVMPEVSADSARQSRLRDAVWMLDTEVALNDGLTGVAEQVVTRAPANDVSRQFDADAGRLVEQLFGSVPEDVSEGARKFARENADSVLGSATAAWHAGDAAAGPGTALQALQKNLLGLFRGGRSAGADADSLTGEALSRIELLRGALPDEALGSLGKWSRGMAAAADLDSALTRGDAARAEQALAGKALADSLPEEARREFARRAAIVRQRSKAAETRQTLRAGVEAFGEAGGGGEKLDAAVEKAAASTRIRDADERAAFGWSLRQDLARTRAIKQARGLAVERSFRSSLKDGSADPEALFGLLDRAEQEGLLDDSRLTLLRREQATALEHRTLEWRETVEGAALLRDPSGFDRTNTVHRRQVDLWWKKTLEQLTPADLQPDAAEQGIFADLRSEDEQRLPGLDDDPMAVARDIVPRIGYLPKSLRGQILTVWCTGDAAALAPLAELTADLLGESPAALDDLPPATTAGLLLTAAWVRGGARPDKALETARNAVAGEITAAADLSAALELLLSDEAAADDPILAASRQKLSQVADSLGVAGNSPASPAAGSGPAEAPAPRAVRAESAASGDDRLHGGAGNDALDGSYRYGDPDRKVKTGAKLDEISKLPPQSRPLDISDEDGKAVIRDPETGDVLGEAGFRTVDAIEALLAGAGLDKDFDRLTEDEKQALIDAAGMIPGLGEGISALQAYEAALQAKAAWERGDFGEAAGNAALALLDGAGAVPLVGKAAKLVRLFGGFIARNARKLGRHADAITPDTGLAMATAGGAGNPVRGNRPSGQPDDPGRREPDAGSDAPAFPDDTTRNRVIREADEAIKARKTPVEQWQDVDGNPLSKLDHGEQPPPLEDLLRGPGFQDNRKFLTPGEFHSLAKSGGGDVVMINPQTIRSTQVKFSDNFSKPAKIPVTRNGKTEELSFNSITAIEEYVKRKIISKEDVQKSLSGHPLTVTEKDGMMFTLDHRRMVLARRLKIDIPVRFKKYDELPPKLRGRFGEARMTNNGVYIFNNSTGQKE